MTQPALPTDTALHVALVALGVLLIAVGLLLAPGYTCTDGGSVGEPPGAFGFLGIQHGDIAWTPDGGVNTCRIDLAIILEPTGAVLGSPGIWQMLSG